MPKIEMWKCPQTGLLFKSKEEYKSHLQMLASSNLRMKKNEAIASALEDTFKQMRYLADLDHICEFINDNSISFALNGHLRWNHQWQGLRSFDPKDHGLKVRSVPHQKLNIVLKANKITDTTQVVGWGGTFIVEFDTIFSARRYLPSDMFFNTGIDVSRSWRNLCDYVLLAEAWPGLATFGILKNGV